jgi:DNA-binding XRE family transcriptional regulator
VLLWHHLVHRARGESLYFWRLGFYPTYDATRANTAIHKVLSSFEVRAAVCYEVYGPHDLMLRVWLPSTCDDATLSDALVDAVPDLNMCDPFHVKRAVRHWMFPHDEDGVIPPTQDDLRLLNDPRLVAAAEAGELTDPKLEELSSRSLLGTFAANPQTTDPDDPGTKFAVVFSGDPRLTTQQHLQFEITLTESLDNARRIEQRSLYSGSGFGHFVVLGMVKGHPLCVLNEDLLTPIAQQNIDRLYNARSYTHVSGRRNYVFIYESLFDPVPPAPIDPGRGSPAAQNGSGADPSAGPGPDPVIGEVFAERFLIDREIGHGGFSRVYAVTDELDGQFCALKVFSSGRADQHVRREIGFLRKVEHPRVMRVYWGARTPEDRWYIVSELVDGTPLDTHLKNGSTDPAAAIQIEDELLEALEAIHPNEQRIEELKSGELTPEAFAEFQELQHAGFVHRDVKPGNIMLTDRGIKLLDFNIASRAGDPVKTKSGTPAYQPPDGSAAVWDVSTDLFAAGIVLYELLVGEHPYPESEPRADLDPRNPRELLPELPAPLADFLLRACATCAENRYLSAREMKQALRLATRPEGELAEQALGERVRALREAAGEQIRSLAQRAEVEERLLAAVEKGEASATVTQAQRLANALGVPLAQLLEREDHDG